MRRTRHTARISPVPRGSCRDMSAHARLLGGSCLFLIVLTAVALTASASLYHFYDGVSDPPPTFPSTGKAVAISSAQWAAQSFRASASYILTRVSVWAQYASNASEASMVEVRSDGGGLPNMAAPPLGSDTQFGPAAYRWV